jgi:hypothetical protein
MWVSVTAHAPLVQDTCSDHSPTLLCTKRMTTCACAQGSENTRRLLLRQRTRHARAWCKGKQLLKPWPGDCCCWFVLLLLFCLHVGSVDAAPQHYPALWTTASSPSSELLTAAPAADAQPRGGYPGGPAVPGTQPHARSLPQPDAGSQHPDAGPICCRYMLLVHCSLCCGASTTVSTAVNGSSAWYMCSQQDDAMAVGCVCAACTAKHSGADVKLSCRTTAAG